MGASFEEKSVWIQLVGTALSLAAYLSVAGYMLSRGVTALAAYAGVFVVSVAVLVILLVLGHVLAAITGRTEPRDERDRLIAWRAEKNSSWVLAAGVFFAISCMMLKVDNVWTAHLLLLSLYLSEMLGYTLRLVYYRRGMGRV